MNIEWTPVVPGNTAAAAPPPIPVQIDPKRPMTVVLYPTSACAPAVSHLPVAWFNA